MTGYMLDSSVVAALVRDPAGPVARRIAEVGEQGLCLSVIVAAELRHSAIRSRSHRVAARVEAILARLPVLPLEAPAADDYGDIRAGLEAAGAAIGPNDLLIAAHARAIGATLVTARAGAFAGVAGLRVENWLG